LKRTVTKLCPLRPGLHTPLLHSSLSKSSVV